MIKSFDQAKVVSIDKNKGRVTLFAKNGLVSAGTYLYDINDLKTGMAVLIGDVDGTKVILDKVAASPKNGSGLSSILPLISNSGIDYIKLIIDDVVVINDHFDQSIINTSIWTNTYHYREKVGGVWEERSRIYPELDGYSSLLIADSCLVGASSPICYNWGDGFFYMFSSVFPSYSIDSEITFEISFRYNEILSLYNALTVLRSDVTNEYYNSDIYSFENFLTKIIQLNITNNEWNWKYKNNLIDSWEIPDYGIPGYTRIFPSVGYGFHLIVYLGYRKVLNKVVGNGISVCLSNVYEDFSGGGGRSNFEIMGLNSQIDEYWF